MVHGWPPVTCMALWRWRIQGTALSVSLSMSDLRYSGFSGFSPLRNPIAKLLQLTGAALMGDQSLNFDGYSASNGISPLLNLLALHPLFL